MRVGVYLGDFEPQQGGGYTFVADLFDALVQSGLPAGHELILIGTPSATRALSAALDRRLPVVTVPSIKGWRRLLLGLKYFSPLVRRLLGAASGLEQLAAKNKLDLIWFVGVGAFESPDVPYVATLWDLQHRVQPFFPEVSAAGEWDKREQFYSYFLRRAAYCVTGTHAGKAEIQGFYHLHGDRVRVISLPTPRYALEAAETQLDVRTRFGLKRPYVFYPAQFWPHKNHINLLLALAELRDAHGLELDLVLVGADKGNRTFVQQMAEQLGLAGCVHFPGFVSQDELIALYRQAEALVFVSLFGPDNIPPLEAFALGCPVITSHLSGSDEQYGDAALLVDASSPGRIVEAVIQVLNDPGVKAALIKRGYVRARQWTAQNYLQSIFDLFDEFAAIRRNWPHTC
jgi:glycosyltransferase involved in cell wall biosynthesis